MKLGSVVDWLNGLPEEDPLLLDRLMLVRWDQAVEHARLWHERLARFRRAGVAGDRGTANHLPVRRMDGWLWMQLVTKGALDREGAVMGHCVGSRAYDRHAWTGDYQGSPLGIWSLRDPAGKSVATVEVGTQGILQAFGRANERPAPETAPAFETLVGFFADPGQRFCLPRWLERTEDGQTRLATKPAGSEYSIGRGGRGQAYFRQVRGQILIADEVDYGIEIQQVDVDRYLRARERPIGQIVTELTEAVTFTCPQFTPLLEALGAMAGEAVSNLVAIVGEQAAAEFDAIETPVRGTRNQGGEPWYRQHERQRQGRRPR